MRTVPPAVIRNTLRDFDSAVLRVFHAIADLESDELIQLQISLPLNLTGLGLISTERHASAAFFASCANCAPILRQLLSLSNEDRVDPFMQDAANNLRDRFPDSAALLEDLPLVEESIISELINRADFDRLVDLVERMPQSELRSLHLLRLSSQGSVDSFGFLTAVPNKNLGLFISNDAFSMALRFHLAGFSNDHPGSVPGICDCVRDFDRTGLDALKCKRHGKAHQRHNNQRNSLASIARSAGFNVQVEPPGLIAANTNLRPADILIEDFATHGRAAIDIVVKNPKQHQFLTGNRSIQQLTGIVAVSAHNAKIHKYSAHLAAEHNDLEYIPFARDVYGRFTDMARDVIAVIADKRSSFNGSKSSLEFFRIMQLLSVQLVKDNASALLAHRRIPLAIAESDVVAPVNVLPFNGALDLRVARVDDFAADLAV